MAEKRMWLVHVDYLVEANDAVAAALAARRQQHDDEDGFDTTYRVIGKDAAIYGEAVYDVRVWVPKEQNKLVAGIVGSPDETVPILPFIKE